MKKLLLLALITMFARLQAQQYGRWYDLFSYNNVLAIGESDSRLMAATENGIFYYNTISGEISKLSKANGLHEVKITAFDYNSTTKTALVGYQNGTLDVISPEGITYIVDIPLAQNYTGNKKINHISITGNLAVISVGYGVSIFNLTKKEFGDSCFFMSNGVFESSKEAIIKDNTVLSITNAGLKSHVLDGNFPIYSSWSNVQGTSGTYSNIDNGGTMAFSDQNTVYFGNTIGSWSSIAQSFTNIKDVVVSDRYIMVAHGNAVSVFDLNGALLQSLDASEEVNTGYFINNKIFAGTSSSGIIDSNLQSIKPDGPYSNTSYRISLLNDQIWISSGGWTENHDPIYRGLGYYHFNGTQWQYPDFFKTNPYSYNVFDVVPNPQKPSEVYFSNYVSSSSMKGIYKMENNIFVKKYSSDNNDWYYRSSGLVFDENNTLFNAVTHVGTPPGWADSLGFYTLNVANDALSTTVIKDAGAVVSKPVIKNKILWLPSSTEHGGVVAFNYRSNISVYLNMNNGLPSNDVKSLAVDSLDDLWIGTGKGLRVLANANAADANSKANPIIISQSGIAEELFKDARINQIAVDSGNQKWISVERGGVFYLNSSGEKTYHHFTKGNSPLPNDSVTDIAVDDKTGKVYFVTTDGVVVYHGDVARVSSDFGDVLVYPNPVVYSNYKGNVKIKGLAEKTNIKITDSAGNLVHQAVARGGFYEWDLNNSNGVRVASGIYFVLMTNEDATDKATAKIAVVN